MSWDSPSDVWIQPRCPHLVTSSSDLMSSRSAIPQERLQVPFPPTRVLTIVCGHSLSSVTLLEHMARSAACSPEVVSCADMQSSVHYFFFFLVSRSLVAYVFACGLLSGLASSKRCLCSWVFPSRWLSLGTCGRFFSIFCESSVKVRGRGGPRRALWKPPSTWTVIP